MCYIVCYKRNSIIVCWFQVLHQFCVLHVVQFGKIIVLTLIGKGPFTDIRKIVYRVYAVVLVKNVGVASLQSAQVLIKRLFVA